MKPDIPTLITQAEREQLYGKITIESVVASLPLYAPRKPRYSTTTPKDGLAMSAQGNTLLGESPTVFAYTEGGNAERLVAEHKDNFRYLTDDRVWLAWDGRRWKRDATAEIHAAAKTTVRDMRHLAADVENEDERRRFAAWAHPSDRRAVRENMVALAQYEPGKKALRSYFDRKPWLLKSARAEPIVRIPRRAL